MEYTSNYNLSKQGLREKISIDAINQNMDTIDTTLKSLSENINSVESNIPSTDALITNTELNQTLTDYAKLSDIPTSLPASDVFDWAKSETKPTYTKSEIGLGNVENKSSATIRGELTKEDVVTALGYTPIESSSEVVTYELTKSGSTITLTGSDGSTTSVTDSTGTNGTTTVYNTTEPTSGLTDGMIWIG